MNCPYILISLATDAKTRDWEFGHRFLETLLRVNPKLTPEFMSSYEPIKTPFVSVAEAERLWAPTMMVHGPDGQNEANSDFLWKIRKNLKFDGHIMHTSTTKSGKVILGQVSLQSRPDDSVDWLALFNELCELARPRFGMLHLFTKQEFTEVEFNSPQSLFQNGPPGWAVQSSIPNLAWASFLGDELAEEVEIADLAYNGFDVASMSNGHLITVTKSLSDVAERFDEFDARRRTLKGLFRAGLFQI